MAVMLFKYAKASGNNVSYTSTDKLKTFSDAESVDNWAKDAMAWAINNGILSGMGDKTLAPTAQAKRAQVAKILLNSSNTLTAK